MVIPTKESDMKKLFLIAALLLGVVLNSKAAFAWGSAGGDGSSFAALQETAVFFNNSGATLSAGQVVILDTAGTGVAADSTLGAYVTLVNAADSARVVGVVKSTSVADQKPVVVVTKGPIDTQCADSGDAVSINTAVGTTTIGTSGGSNGVGLCGGGTNLGVALEAGDGTNSGKLYVWVDPTGAK
jgi:hypothetical protein